MKKGVDSPFLCKYVAYYILKQTIVIVHIVMTDLSLKPISQPKTLREMAYHSIKEVILTGGMKPNAFYSEPSLAKLLEISRTPTREALQELVAEGFVEAVPKRGYRIRSFEMAEIENLYDFRMAIELAIIKQVAGAIEDRQLLEIEKILRTDQAAAKEKDLISFVKANRDFHRYLASLTHNPYFIDSMEKILGLTDWAALNVQKRKHRPPHAVKEHTEIYSALVERDSKKAYAAMEGHLLTSKKLALQEMKVEGAS